MSKRFDTPESGRDLSKGSRFFHGQIPTHRPELSTFRSLARPMTVQKTTDQRSAPKSGGPIDPAAIEDRGIIHAADAMRSMYDMGDAPSCHTCGAIMVRNGSCYRCMSCGSTSGCS